MKPTDDRCVGCGDIAAFCDSLECASVRQSHAFSLHGLCDRLVCDDSTKWEDIK